MYKHEVAISLIITYINHSCLWKVWMKTRSLYTYDSVLLYYKNQSIRFTYIDILKCAYENASSVFILFGESNERKIKRSIRQVNTILSKFSTAVLEEIHRTLNWKDPYIDMKVPV